MHGGRLVCWAVPLGRDAEKGPLAVRELTLRRPPAPGVVLPEGLPAFLKLLAEPNRLRILMLLARGEQCVCDIEAALDLPQNLVSHHLVGHLSRFWP